METMVAGGAVVPDIRIEQYLEGSAWRDMENVPEMKTLAGVDIAFLPMNLPYTMPPEMVADAARMIRPKILYPYHFGETDTSRIVELLRDQKETEVRIRQMQ